MGRRKVLTGTPLPKALVCGLLEDEGRILFLIRRETNGIERIEMPCVIIRSGRSPFAEMKELFPKQTGIDAEIGEPIAQIEAKQNVGTRKAKMWVPCIIFKFNSKRCYAKPDPKEFVGFKWLTLEQAKHEKLARNSEWIKNIRKA